MIQHRILYHRLRGAWLTYLAEVGLRKGVVHPPIFDDLKRFGWGPYSFVEIRNDELHKVFQAGMLTERDLTRISTKPSIPEWVGAALQTNLHDPTGLFLLQKAAEAAPSNASVWAALVHQLATLLGNHVGDESALRSLLGEAIQRWNELEPTNGVAAYFRADLAVIDGHGEKAGGQFLFADGCVGFETHAPILRSWVLRAYESVHFSPFSARVLALRHTTA